MEFSSQRLTRLTFDLKEDAIAVWSPDGRQIAYTSTRNGIRQLYRNDAGGGGRQERLLTSTSGQAPTDWSRDGRYLLYAEADPKTEMVIWVLPMDGERKPKLVL